MGAACSTPDSGAEATFPSASAAGSPSVAAAACSAFHLASFSRRRRFWSSSLSISLGASGAFGASSFTVLALLAFFSSSSRRRFESRSRLRDRLRLRSRERERLCRSRFRSRSRFLSLCRSRLRDRDRERERERREDFFDFFLSLGSLSRFPSRSLLSGELPLATSAPDSPALSSSFTSDATTPESPPSIPAPSPIRRRKPRFSLQTAHLVVSTSTAAIMPCSARLANLPGPPQECEGRALRSAWNRTRERLSSQNIQRIKDPSNRLHLLGVKAQHRGVWTFSFHFHCRDCRLLRIQARQGAAEHNSDVYPCRKESTDRT